MDDTPSSAISDPPPFVNPQLDATITTPKQKAKLNADFDSFWQEQDAKPAPAITPQPEAEKQAPSNEQQPPQAPEAEQSTQETIKAEPPKAELPKTETVTELPKIEPAKVEEPKKADLDSLEPHPAASEEHKSQFKQLREAAKGFREREKVFKEKLSPVIASLGLELKDAPEEIARVLDEFGNKVKSLKENAFTQETQNELERLRVLARSVGVLQSEEFANKYVKPVNETYEAVVREMAKYFEAPEEQVKTEFIDPMLTKFKPSNIPPEWWSEQIEKMTKAPPVVKKKMEAKIANMLLLQESHDKAADDLANNKLSYADWKKSNEEQAAKDFTAAISDEVRTIAAQDPVLKQIMPVVSDGITDPQQLESIKKHNEHFAELEREFGKVINDFNSGPRSAARRGIEFIHLRERNKFLSDSITQKESELDTIKQTKDAELKAANEEITKLREEVTKRRKISDAPTKPTAGVAAKPTPEKKPLPKDARKSLASAYEEWNKTF